MKSELNLYIMSVQDVVDWYKPQTEAESYLVNLLSEIENKTTKQFQDENDNLKTENEDLQSENDNLEDMLRNFHRNTDIRFI